MFQSKVFNTIVKQVQSTWNIPSLVYGLILNEKLAEINSVGNAEENTLFRIGSNGKSITAAMLLHELKSQNLNIHQKFSDLNKHIKFSDTQYANQIQIKDILTHCTGHGKFTCSMMAYLGYTEDNLVKAFQHIPFLKAPGCSFQYQNGLYLLAGKLVEHLSGVHSTVYFKEHLYNPLGMNETYMGLSNTPVDRLAIPYTEVNKNNESMNQSTFADAIGTGGNINTSVFDLSQWILANLKASRNGKESLFEKQLFSFITFNQDLNPDFCLNKLIKWNAYGLGWYLNSFKHHCIIEHLGGVPGYTSFMSFSPTLDAGIVLLCNKTDMRYALEYLRMAFYSLIIDANVPLAISELYTQTSNYQTALKEKLFYQKKLLPSTLKNVELRLYNPQYGHITFDTKDASPKIFFELTKYLIPLAYIGENKFIAEDIQHNFNTSLKRVAFHLSFDHNQISMQIDMDNQQGGLTFIETQIFVKD